jgi:hypothetical protein
LTDFLVDLIPQGNDETGFYHDCTFLSVYQCFIARRQIAKTFVADERVPLNKPENKNTKW